jgi:hypothetical protein
VAPSPSGARSRTGFCRGLQGGVDEGPCARAPLLGIPRVARDGRNRRPSGPGLNKIGSALLRDDPNTWAAPVAGPVFGNNR